MQLFIFAAPWSLQSHFRCQETRFAGEDTPSEWVSSLAVSTTCGGVWKWCREPHVFDLDQLFADMIALLQRDGRNMVVGTWFMTVALCLLQHGARHTNRWTSCAILEWETGYVREVFNSCILDQSSPLWDVQNWKYSSLTSGKCILSTLFRTAGQAYAAHISGETNREVFLRGAGLNSHLRAMLVFHCTIDINCSD